MNKCLLSAALLCNIGASAQTENAGIGTYFSYGSFAQKSDTLNYRIIKPEDWDVSQKYPLVIFLHGSGERGGDNEAQLTHGADLFAANRNKVPAFVVFPQCMAGDYWAVENVEQLANGRIFTFPEREKMNTSLGLVYLLIDSLQSLYPVDASRIYVMGMSMGGKGTYELVSRRPDTFAAAIAICGGGNEAAAAKYATKTPFWVFHGEQDDVVPPALSVAMARALAKAGGNPKLTLYPDANHNSWDRAFSEPDLLNWLYSHSK